MKYISTILVCAGLWPAATVCAQNGGEKDLKVCQKRHYNMALLQQVINVLAVPEQLPPQNRDHSLTGSYIPHRECHIQPDWLLIYYQTDTELYLYRTGTHADLFGL